MYVNIFETPNLGNYYERELKNIKEFEKGKDINGQKELKGIKLLTGEDVLLAHFLIVDYFSKNVNKIKNYHKNIGGVGTRDITLFMSSIERQHNCIQYCKVKSENRLKYFVFATLYWGLIKNHVFHDANKRTATLSLLYHLYLNRLRINVKDKVLEEMAIRVASNTLLLRNDWVRKYVERSPEIVVNEEITLIANFLRNNTSNRSIKYAEITYRDLERALANYGYYFGKPKNNKVTIYKYDENPKKKPSFLNRLFNKNKIVTISYIDKNKTVPKNTIKLILNKTGLNPETLYSWGDLKALEELIGEYRNLLKRLAKR